MAELPDDEAREYSASMIAEHTDMHCDISCNQYRLLDATIDHESDHRAMEHTKYVLSSMEDEKCTRPPRMVGTVIAAAYKRYAKRLILQVPQ